MRAGVNLKAVRDSIVIEDVVQLGGVEAQSVLIAHVHRDGAILLQISDVLIDESQRRVGRVFRHDLRLRNAVLGWQIEIERRILRIGRPRRRRCKLREAKPGDWLPGPPETWPRQPSSRWRSPAPSSDRRMPGPPPDHRRHAAGAHDVESCRRHRDASCRCATRRSRPWSGRPVRGCAIGDGAVVRVDVSDHIVRDELLEIAGGGGT